MQPIIHIAVSAVTQDGIIRLPAGTRVHGSIPLCPQHGGYCVLVQTPDGTADGIEFVYTTQTTLTVGTSE